MLSPEIRILKPSPAPFDPEQIPGTHERQMALFLQERFPYALIEYESRQFTLHFYDGKTRSTIPDLRLVRTDRQDVFLELTTMERNGTDPKARQREVMENFPEVVYRVLYGGDLFRIQQRWGMFLTNFTPNGTEHNRNGSSK